VKSAALADAGSKICMEVFAFFEFGEVSVSRWQWFQRCWASFGLLLILATWRLWIPQSVYPQDRCTNESSLQRRAPTAGWSESGSAQSSDSSRRSEAQLR
jgi:hypothetical protein